jgi:hypothetical protein
MLNKYMYGEKKNPTDVSLLINTCMVKPTNVSLLETITQINVFP